jgi:hypothetical protein
MVGDVRFADQRDRDDLLGLVVVERLKDELVKIFDVDGSSTGLAGGVNGLFGQGVSWRTMASRNDVNARDALSFGDAKGGFAREWRLRRSDRAAGEGK